MVFAVRAVTSVLTHIFLLFVNNVVIVVKINSSNVCNCHINNFNLSWSPKAYPLVGSVPYLSGVNISDIEQVTNTFVNNFSSPFRFWVGNTAYINLYDGEHVKAVLQSRCFEKSSIYKIFKPAFRTGLLTSSVSLWSSNRKMIERMFTSNNLRIYFNIFVEQSLALMGELKKVEQNGNEIILLDFLHRSIFNIACETTLGVKVESQLVHRLLKQMTSIKEIWTYRLSNIFLHPNVIFNLSTTKWRQQKQLNCANLLVDEILQRKHAFDKFEATKSNSKTFLIDILLKACHEGRLTRQELLDHVITMLFTAIDTTAVTINFVTFMLANFPEVQEKAYKELSEIYGNESPKSVPIKYDDLQKMDYLNRVIKETMRLFPAAPLIGRILTEDLKIGETILPKGADVLMSIFHMHRNKKHWSNPLMFDPDRFLPEKEEHFSKYFVPFSIGLRNCIGQKYAMISMKVILATLIRTFEFKVDKNIKIDEIKLSMDATLCTVNPLKVKIKKRDY
ncbi:cytochrome P450 4C1-like isoform X1 [Linepithema humile]|uniref:cytochrome P450 4C1-like isoform X1 n=1 Tax=Linepithema humile TaxID=83485 RepID=UPI00351F6FBB